MKLRLARVKLLLEALWQSPKAAMRIFFRVLIPVWILMIALGGYVAGLQQATRWERAICRIRVESVETQRNILVKMIVQTFAKSGREKTPKGE